MAAAAAARRHYRGLIWLGRARRAGGAPESLLFLLGKKLCLTFELYFGSNLRENLSKLDSGGLFGCVFSWKADSEVYDSSHAVKEDIPAQHESHKALYVHA